MTEEARKIRNKYRREYYQKNREKIRAQQAAYWERRAKREREDAGDDSRNAQNRPK